MTRAERHTTVRLACVFALRMLGLFIILPVFTLHASDLDAATPTLVGMALGAYGLTQAVCQIPAGRLSDRIGRKPVIIGGLLLFALGSAVAALSVSIYGVLLGRLLQGMGAIASALMALASDHVREEHRTKSMAVFGISIGVAFGLSMVAGPILYAELRLAGMFWFAGCLALAAIVIIASQDAPAAPTQARAAQATAARVGQMLAENRLFCLHSGIFCLHFVLMSNFVAVPVLLQLNLPVAEHWYVYLPAFALSVLAMAPVVRNHEVNVRRRLGGSAALLVITEFALASNGGSPWAVGLLLAVFFSCFNVLEATLPSLVSRYAPHNARGTALGIFSTAQFLGTFCGGLTGGWLAGTMGLSAIFICNATVAGLWALAVTQMPGEQPSK